jgi:hypothetical protein
MLELEMTVLMTGKVSLVTSLAQLILRIALKPVQVLSLHLSLRDRSIPRARDSLLRTSDEGMLLRVHPEMARKLKLRTRINFVLKGSVRP